MQKMFPLTLQIVQKGNLVLSLHTMYCNGDDLERGRGRAGLAAGNEGAGLIHPKRGVAHGIAQQRIYAEKTRRFSESWSHPQPGTEGEAREGPHCGKRAISGKRQRRNCGAEDGVLRRRQQVCAVPAIRVVKGGGRGCVEVGQQCEQEAGAGREGWLGRG